MKKQKRTVGEIISKKFVSISKNMDVLKVGRLMTKHKSRYAIVIEKKKAIGMITENDILRKVFVKNIDGNSIKAHEIMTKKPICLPVEADFVPLYDLMKSRGIKQFPVEKKGNIIGIVTEEAILAGMAHLIKDLDWKLISTKVDIEDLYYKLEKIGLLE